MPGTSADRLEFTARMLLLFEARHHNHLFPFNPMSEDVDEVWKYATADRKQRVMENAAELLFNLDLQFRNARSD